LYDKVETYDKLKDIIQENLRLMDCRSFKRDERYRASYVTFFDNHDEQRLASPEFAGTAEKGKPLMVVSTTISSFHNDLFWTRSRRGS
jgi:hypothetical protein